MLVQWNLQTTTLVSKPQALRKVRRSTAAHHRRLALLPRCPPSKRLQTRSSAATRTLASWLWLRLRLRLQKRLQRALQREIRR